MNDYYSKKITIAIPKGRIYQELSPIMEYANIIPEKDFFDNESRKLLFTTNDSNIQIIRVRSFDVPTFVAYGGADIGIAGSDVLAEFSYTELYSPLDLKIANCRLSVAEPVSIASEDDPSRWSNIRIATKYPNIAKKHFAKRGVQVECIKLNGAMELAPLIGLSDRIVDLVDSGATIKANGLVEIEKIMDISSRLIVNRTAFKTRNTEINKIIEKFKIALCI